MCGFQVGSQKEESQRLLPTGLSTETAVWGGGTSVPRVTVGVSE